MNENASAPTAKRARRFRCAKGHVFAVELEFCPLCLGAWMQSQWPLICEVPPAAHDGERDCGPLTAFLAAHTVSDATAYAPFGLLYRAYSTWSLAQGIQPMSLHGFAVALKQVGFTRGSLDDRVIWHGLRLIEIAQAGDGEGGGA